MDALSSADAAPGQAQIAMLASMMKVQRQAGADMVAMMTPAPKATSSTGVDLYL